MLKLLKKVSKIALFSSLFLVNYAYADINKKEIHKKVDAVLNELQKGDSVKSWEILREVENKVWNNLSFTIEKALLIQSRARGWGVFDPRNNNIFSRGDMMYFYIEPIGYHYNISGHGDNTFYNFGLRIGFTIKNETGEIIFSNENVGSSNWVSRHPIHELYVDFRLPIGRDVQPGKYQLIISLTDLVSGQTAKTTIPFVVRK